MYDMHSSVELFKKNIFLTVIIIIKQMKWSLHHAGILTSHILFWNTQLTEVLSLLLFAPVYNCLA